MLLSGEEGAAVVKQRAGRYGGEEGEERRGQAALLFKTEGLFFFKLNTLNRLLKVFSFLRVGFATKCPLDYDSQWSAGDPAEIAFHCIFPTCEPFLYEVSAALMKVL